MNFYLAFRQSPQMSIAMFTLLAALAGSARASTLTFYTTAGSFNAANPGITTENFSNAVLVPPNLALQPSPLSSTTNSSVFPSGSIVPGMTISNSNSLNTPGLIVYPAGVLAGAGNAVGTNSFGDALVLGFSTGTTAVGADIFAATGPGQTLAGTFTEDVYAGSTLLGSSTFSELQGELGFLGVSSDTPITAIDLLYTTDDASTFVGGVYFDAASSTGPPGPTGPTGPGPTGPGPTGPGPTGPGPTGPTAPGGPTGPIGPTTSPVPEPSTWSLLTLGLASLAGCKSLRLRKQS